MVRTAAPKIVAAMVAIAKRLGSTLVASGLGGSPATTMSRARACTPAKREAWHGKWLSTNASFLLAQQPAVLDACEAVGVFEKPLAVILSSQHNHCSVADLQSNLEAHSSCADAAEQRLTQAPLRPEEGRSCWPRRISGSSKDLQYQAGLKSILFQEEGEE